MSLSSLWVHVTPEAALDAFGLVAVPGLAWVVVVTRQILRLERSTVEVAVPEESPASSGAASWAAGRCGDRSVTKGRVVEQPPAGGPTP